MATEKGKAPGHEAAAKKLVNALPARLKKSAALNPKASTTAIEVGGRRVAEVQPGGSAWVRVPGGDAGEAALAAAVEAALEKPAKN